VEDEAVERLHLGGELHLERKFAPIERAGINPGLARFRPRATPGARLTLPAVPEQYRFTELASVLELRGEALSQLHLVFGGPGSGKSHFFLHLLRQLVDAERWPEAWGGLLLDPKGTLARTVIERLKPPQVVRVGGALSSRINLLASHLPPHDLGVALALAAQSAGVGGGREPYWINQLKLLFGAGLAALQLLAEPMTLQRLAEIFLGSVTVEVNGKTRVMSLLGNTVVKLEKLESSGSGFDRRRARIMAVLRPYDSATGNNAETARTFVQQVLAPFLDPELDALSAPDVSDSIADMIFRDARWVVLDLPKASLATSKLVATLVKVLFQQAALGRYALYPENRRRVFLMIDEYAELATDLPGEGFGDSIFFSQMREFRILGMIATQGASMLKNSAVKEAWETILTNSSTKFVFRINDTDTAELASRQVGERDFVAHDTSSQRSADGASSSSSQRIERKSEFASGLFLAALQRGQFAILGSSDAVSAATVRFGKVP